MFPPPRPFVRWLVCQMDYTKTTQTSVKLGLRLELYLSTFGVEPGKGMD